MALSRRFPGRPYQRVLMQRKKSPNFGRKRCAVNPAFASLIVPGKTLPPRAAAGRWASIILSQQPGNGAGLIAPVVIGT